LRWRGPRLGQNNQQCAKTETKICTFFDPSNRVNHSVTIGCPITATLLICLLCLFRRPRARSRLGKPSTFQTSRPSPMGRHAKTFITYHSSRAVHAQLTLLLAAHTLPLKPGKERIPGFEAQVPCILGHALNGWAIWRSGFSRKNRRPYWQHLKPRQHACVLFSFFLCVVTWFRGCVRGCAAQVCPRAQPR